MSPSPLVLIWGVSLGILVGSVEAAQAELTRDQIAILANQNSPDSVAVARHYASRRGVPTEHILQLDLPDQETISRDEYELSLVRPLRQVLEERRLASKVRVLVTTYGVPLRIEAPVPSPEQQRWLKDAAERQKFAQAYLERVEEELARIAPSDTTTGDALPSSTRADSASNVNDPLPQRVDHAIRKAAVRLQGVRDREKREKIDEWAKELARLTVLVGGMGALAQNLHPSPTADPGQARAQIETLQQEVASAQKMIQALTGAPSESNRKRAYWLAERMFGLVGVLRLATTELETFSYKDADASLDSELSLLWWDADTYRTAGQTPSPLYYENALLADKQAVPLQLLPVLMVSRLDAPTPQLAMRLVDQAMEAEQQGLSGKVYVDARGMGADTRLSYGQYDQSLRDLATLARGRTSYAVVLDDTEQRFSQPGEAPDVAVYVGWYKLRSYEDAFTFRPGALGYHIASGEAISIHNPTEPGWCKNALERGITVTLGPTGEPYVDAFPLPSEFIGLLLTGRYSLVEAYFLTSRYLSWRMVLFGDPLYNPWRGQGLVADENTVLQPVRSEQKGLPRAPSDLPFSDPVQTRQTLKHQREATLARIHRLPMSPLPSSSGIPSGPRRDK